MLPVIAEIEDVLELLTRLDLFSDLQLGMVQPHQFGRERVIRVADQPAIAQLEVVQVREIPPRERRIDRLRELLKRMRRAHQKDESTLIRSHVRTTSQTTYGGYETASNTALLGCW